MPKIAVVYYSKTGNTEKMAELIAEGCRETEGIEVKMVKLPGADLGAVAKADAFAIGSPDYFSYMAGHVKTFFDDALALKEQFKGKPYVAFCTHGGGGKALETIERLSQSLGLVQAAPGGLCANAPGDDDHPVCRELGRVLAKKTVGA